MSDVPEITVADYSTPGTLILIRFQNRGQNTVHHLKRGMGGNKTLCGKTLLPRRYNSLMAIPKGYAVCPLCVKQAPTAVWVPWYRDPNQHAAIEPQKELQEESDNAKS